MNSKKHLDEMIQTVLHEIKQKLKDFCKSQDDAHLTPEVAADVSKGLHEAALESVCMGYQVFIESYDIDEPTIQINNEVYRRKLISEKRIMSVFGPLKINRRLYQRDKGGKTHSPLDTMWGMEGEYATPEVREAALFTVAHVTTKETEAILKKCASFHPSATAIQNMAIRAGSIIGNNEKVLNEEIRNDEKAPVGTRVLVGSLDGVNILLNEPGPQKGRPKERPGGTSGESKTSYRNAMVGSVSFYGDVLPEKHTPERLQSRYTAQMPEEKWPTLKARFENEFDHAKTIVESEVIKVILCDGHKSIWNYVDLNPFYNDCKKLVDFYHASEHLSRAAEALFGGSNPDARDWYDCWYDKLLEKKGAVGGLIRSIDYYRKVLKLSKSRKSDILKERTYFRNNKKRMTYAEFINMGLPIGSGPVEAACKTIVKTRMCRSGMRWSREGGQHILQLRTYLKSKRWDSFWSNHLKLSRAA